MGRHRHRRRDHASWIVLFAALAAATAPGPTAEAAPSSASERTVEGRVLSVEGAIVIVDVAAGRGAKQGDVVELWRPVVLRHPVTRRPIKDRFLLGRLRLDTVGSELAKARAEGVLEDEPTVGDVVVLEVAAQALPTGSHAAASGADRNAAGTSPAARGAASAVSPILAPTDGEAGPAERGPSANADGSDSGARAAEAEPSATAPLETSHDPEAEHVAALFVSLRGATVVRRIQAYEQYCRSHPGSRFAPTLHEEAAALRALVRSERESAEPIVTPVKVHHDPPIEALTTQPLSLAFRTEGETGGLLLHLRTAGEPSYRTLDVQPRGPGYYGVTLSISQLELPALEYFLEARQRDGPMAPAVGSARAPLRVELREPPSYERLRPERATVALWTDYADYNRLRGNDTAWQTEGYFAMRFGELGVRTLRSGFGVYRGVGGTLEDLDELELSPRKIGLTYGYLEAEFGIHDLFGVLGRPVIGLKDGGVTGGAQIALRIGNDRRTNLQLGAEALGGVGLRSFAQLELEELEDWPLLFRAEVSNQPAGTSSSLGDVRPEEQDITPEETSIGKNEVGFRGIVQVGYRFIDALVVSARVSYQGRTIEHSGPGFGGGVSFTW